MTAHSSQFTITRKYCSVQSLANNLTGFDIQNYQILFVLHHFDDTNSKYVVHSKAIFSFIFSIIFQLYLSSCNTTFLPCSRFLACSLFVHLYSCLLLVCIGNTKFSTLIHKGLMHYSSPISAVCPFVHMHASESSSYVEVILQSSLCPLDSCAVLRYLNVETITF